MLGSNSPFTAEQRKYVFSLGFMMNLFTDSQRQFHRVFTQTYGVLYERNARLFKDTWLVAEAGLAEDARLESRLVDKVLPMR